MGRRAACEAFGMKDFDAQVGHVEARRSEALLDEIPGAYKDIGEVMAWARDLVEVVHRFRPLANAKGD